MRHVLFSDTFRRRGEGSGNICTQFPIRSHSEYSIEIVFSSPIRVFYYTFSIRSFRLQIPTDILREVVSVFHVHSEIAAQRAGISICAVAKPLARALDDLIRYARSLVRSKKTCASICLLVGVRALD